MSSGFISAGTTEVKRDAEWLAAQAELEVIRARKAAEARPADGRSLFETLEANKAAKQDAFEEAARLKNQFRSLDEDEIEFLDSVMESTRAEEDRVRRETAEGLEVFRRAQEEADKAARGEDKTGDSKTALEEVTEDGGEWSVGGKKLKRKRKGEVLKGVKLRRVSETTEAPQIKAELDDKKVEEKVPKVVAAKPSPTPAKKNELALVDYGSDSDD